MPLPTGAISAENINTELGQAAGTAVSFNATNPRLLADAPTGPVSMDAMRGSAALYAATGGTVSDSGGYRYHDFTAAGTLTISQKGSIKSTINAFALGGGGQGGASGGGGGGGGGLLEFDASPDTGDFAVTVGAGTSWSGGSSSVFGQTASGGGGGGNRSGSGSAGGSGGGPGCVDGGTYGVGTDGQGYRGGYKTSVGNWPAGCGGGGTGAVGGNSCNRCNGGAGGSGRLAILDGVRYGGGGGGCGLTGTGVAAGGGGAGGGGAGGRYDGSYGVTGTNGLGGGGGANGYSVGVRRNGGSGRVKLRYEITI